MNSWLGVTKIEAFCTKNEDFDQIYLNTGSKNQNVERLSLDLIFQNDFWYKIKSFSKHNSKLRIHSKPDTDWNQSKLTVCCGSVSDDFVSLLATSTEIMWWFLSNITCFFIDWSSLKEEYDEINFFDSSAEKYQNKQ